MPFIGQDFPAEVPLGDWIIQNLAPTSGLVQAPITGATGSATTNNYVRVTGTASGDPPVFSSNTTQLTNGLAAEVTRIEITPPVVSNTEVTVYPDFQVSPMPDGSQALVSYTQWDGSYGTNMMPPQANTVGRQQTVIGEPWFRVAQAVLAGVPYYYSPEQQTLIPVTNVPLLVTGIKFNASMQAILSSQRGWGYGVAGDTVVTPGRVRMWGYVYSDAMLQVLQSAWNGVSSFSRQGLRRQFEGLPAIAGTSLWTPRVATWNAGPNGWQQKGGAQIYRYFDFAQNLAATSPNKVYALSNNPSVGAAGQVGNQGYNGDLGWPFAPIQGNAATIANAVILQEFGVPGGVTNIAYAGVSGGGTSGTLVPAPNGYPLSANVSDIQFGQVGPQRSGGALFYALPRVRFEAEFSGENAVAFVQDNGTAIAAYAAPGTDTAASNAAEVAVGGYYVVQG